MALIAISAAAFSFLATSSKSATFDEPVHLLSSWSIVNHGDFRVNPEHPPLWKFIAGIPLIGTSIELDLNSPQAKSVFDQIENQGPLATDTLFREAGAGESLLPRARFMMSAFLVLSVFVTGVWARAAGGWIAALIASSLIALDPNFLAHGSLLTNDMAASFVFALAGYLTWRVGRRWSWWTAAGLAVACAAGAGIKFTCVLLVPVVGFPLIVRVMSPHAWPTSSGVLKNASQRWVKVLILAAGATCITIVAAWACYGFRFAPTGSGQTFDESYPRKYLAYNRIAASSTDRGEALTDAEIKALVPDFVPSPSLRLVYWLQDHHLIPQALGYGLTYAAGRGILRPSFLLGDYSDRGFYLYFPVAILTKTPIATLALLCAALILGIRSYPSWKLQHEQRWLILCLLSCPAIYLTFAALSNLNIGVRHILPIYPAVYVAISVALARAICSIRPARFVVPGAIGLLALETATACPNFIAFFNRAVGGERGGLRILSDSNLDWGQDLPALSRWYKAWRAEHPQDTFYLAYFGSVDPRVYGVDYINMSPGFVYDKAPPTLDLNRDGVVAISATWLQGTFPPELRPMMANLRARTPINVINGSIYLYEFKRNVGSR